MVKVKHQSNLSVTRNIDHKMPVIVALLHFVCIYVEDRYTTQTVLKPSGRFYKQLAGFQMGWPNLIHYVHPGPL